MSSDGKEPGAVWQGPKNSQWQLAHQVVEPAQIHAQDDFDPLPEEHIPGNELELSTPTPTEEEAEPPPSLKGLGGLLALLRQLQQYVTFFILPLAFLLLFSIIVLPLIASRPNGEAWPFLLLFVIIALSQGLTAYFLGTSNGFWAAATVLGFCLFLLVSCFALEGLLPTLVLLAILAGLCVLLARSYLHPVAEGYVDIVYRFGKYQRTLYPGLNLILPGEKVTHQLNVGETQWICPSQCVQLSRSEDVVLRAAISYKLVPEDAYLAVTQVNQWEESLRELLLASLQTIATTFMPEDLVAWPDGLMGQTNEGAHWDHINAYLFQHLRDRVALWGVQVNWIRIRDVALVPHGSALVESTPMINMAPPGERQAKNMPGKGGPQKNPASAESKPEDPTQADVPAPGKILKEEVLIKAYKEVQSGKITDPETIRSIAQKFAAIANDQEKRTQVSFDAERAANNLFEQAQKYQEQYGSNLLEPRVERQGRKRVVE